MLKAGLALALAAVAALAAGAASHGAFTGANGRIVFQRGGMYDGARSNLYLVNPNGGGVVRLTRGPQHDAQPTWPADGARIAFESTRRGDTDVWVVGPDASGLKELTFSLGFDGDPS